MEPLCFLSHPTIPKPVLKTRAGESQAVTVKLHLTKKSPQFGIIRESFRNEKRTLIEEIHLLPIQPKGCPPWKYAISLPAKSDSNNAIVFLLGRFRWIWLTDARTQVPWKTCLQTAFPEMVLASIPTNQTPHRLFLEECVDILDRYKTGNPKPEREDPWPPLLRLRWLEILSTVKVSEHQMENSEGRTQVTVQTDVKSLTQRLNRAQEAAAVSLAAFAPNEIPLAQRTIEVCSNSDQAKERIKKALEQGAKWT